ncbi:hypothetical protein J2P86_08345 [Staphylococcus sp. 30400_3112M30941]|nr:hypothetical protein [Staphylococcus sp. 30403_3112M30944]MBO0946454.1 hypothetical protein [Staphylococcus sp. 30402_3112M30943]MBO0964596.1 hypothetical protein [Staphylococcus sp. 30400_3112M30941]MBO0966949.1 hypothetical protein [Staphylococcus sp. 30401_3112M30942]
MKKEKSTIVGTRNYKNLRQIALSATAKEPLIICNKKGPKDYSCSMKKEKSTIVGTRNYKNLRQIALSATA